MKIVLFIVHCYAAFVCGRLYQVIDDVSTLYDIPKRELIGKLIAGEPAPKLNCTREADD